MPVTVPQTPDETPARCSRVDELTHCRRDLRYHV
ncbi:hypothetical protein SOVF_172240 [Spinacia oleracea]|nr:hypothetical protein SOVF_172240 [Spinacia oleracea]